MPFTSGRGTSVDHQLHDLKVFVRTWVAIICVSLVCVTVIMYGLVNGVKVNTHRIALAAYEVCVADNVVALRSRVTIDSAIDAEQRKPHPDPKRIRDLETFRLPLHHCGSRP